MKTRVCAAAVALLAGGAQAAYHGHGHGNVFARRDNATGEVCVPGCTTIWTTMTGAATLVGMTTKTATRVNTKTVTVVKSAASTPATPTHSAPTHSASTHNASTHSGAVIVPTPAASVLPTPGTYSFTATTVTVDKTTTVCGVQSTRLPSGTHTLGGVTTVVSQSKVVTCPVATVVTSGTVTTSTLVQTEYVCPSAGTYIIGPVTTAVTKETDVLYPTPVTYHPGTYTAPARVVTVTKNSYVYFCPFTSSAVSSSSSASSVPATVPTTVSAPPPPPPVKPSQPPVSPAVPSQPPVSSSSSALYSPPAPPPPPPAKPSPSQPQPSQPVASSSPSSSQSAPPKPQPSQPSNGGIIGSSNDHMGITYTPYEPSNGQCKPAEQVEKDIAELKAAGFTTVRVYSTDCHTLDHVGSACQKHGVSLIVGVFVKGSCSPESPDIRQQIDELAAWDGWPLVKLLVVGNEAIMNGHCSPNELRDLVTAVKTKCSRYTGSYTISETLNIWQRSDVSAALCDVVDVTGANIHPFFNAMVTPEMAGDFVASQLNSLAQICKGNDVVNLECGWPTRGTCNGNACPGKAEQATAIRSIRSKTGSKTVFFSYEDDLWKQPGSCGCEQSWGAAAAFSFAVLQ